MMRSVLAETPQPDGGLVVIILVILLGVLVAHVAVVALGSFWAWRAGRGSRLALVGFGIIGALEVLYLMAAVPGLLRGNPSFYLASAALPLAAQVALYAGARAGQGTGR